MSTNSTFRRVNLLMVMVCLPTLVFGSFMATQTTTTAQAASTTPIHVGDSWTGTDTSIGEYGNGSTSKMTFKITSITPATPGYSMGGLLNGYNPAMQIYEGTYAQMQHYWSPQEVINHWGKSPIDRYILINVPHFEALEMVEGNNGVLQGTTDEVGFGLTDEFSLTKDVSSPVKPGGLWIYPNNNFSFVQGNSYTLIARGYQTHPTDPAISYVNITGFWSNVWHVICHIPNNRPDLGDFYYCSTNLKINGKYPPAGAMKLSFDVYDMKGNKNLAPNGTPTGMFSTTATSLSKAEDTLDQKAKPILTDTGHKQSAMGELLGATMLAATCGVELLGVGLLKLPGKLEHAGIIIVKFYKIYDNGRSGSAIALDIVSKQYWDVFIEVVHAINPLDACTTIVKYDIQILYISLQGLVQP